MEGEYELNTGNVIIETLGERSPLAMPGIQAGCILVFVLSLSAYVTPAMIGGLRVKTMAVTVVDALLDTFQWPLGAALALILSLVGAVIVVIFARVTRMKWKAN